MTEKVYVESGFNWFAARKADYIVWIYPRSDTVQNCHFTVWNRKYEYYTL